jgi:hypothetical protein
MRVADEHKNGIHFCYVCRFFIRYESSHTPVGFIFALDKLQGVHKLLWLKAVQSALYFYGVLNIDSK